MVPVLAVGFDDLQQRVDAQTDQTNQRQEKNDSRCVVLFYRPPPARSRGPRGYPRGTYSRALPPRRSRRFATVVIMYPVFMNNLIPLTRPSLEPEVLASNVCVRAAD